LSKNEPFNSKPDKYKKGLLYSKKYDMADLPGNEIILRNLKAALGSYRDYVNNGL
jgi:hypothetical protein